MVRLTELLHASLLVADLPTARAFYEGVLGLTPDANRPDLNFEGVWYAVGGGAIHLLALPNPDPLTGRPEHGGRDRHVALGVVGWAELRARLDAQGLPYSLSRSGRAALFVRDPDGNALELIERPPSHTEKDSESHG
jgi:glyoxylase I family protein